MRAYLLFACLSINACTPFGGFKPPPDFIERFSTANGVTRTEIMTGLLECGNGVPNENHQGPSFEGFSIPIVEECMLHSGFALVKGRKSNCEVFRDRARRKVITESNPMPSVCQPGAEIPTRSVERRLNSPYCKEYSSSRLCQPVVVSKDEWDGMHPEKIAAIKEIQRQGYKTNVGTGEIRFCVQESKKNATRPMSHAYFERCMKETFKVWAPFLDDLEPYDYRVN